MFKIKDNVELKELEKYVKKYGKIKKLYSEENGNEIGYKLFLEKVGNYGKWFELKNGIFKSDYTLDSWYGYYEYYHSEMVHFLYDLIKADLIELI
jgi:hypothetical protein